TITKLRKIESNLQHLFVGFVQPESCNQSQSYGKLKAIYNLMTNAERLRKVVTNHKVTEN
ncbi:hypothetical protein, partial [Bergeyella zoohelcum]|uniref:hypothetical protein n=1 Tax=Bergeyella zoohelcum TaxID=1015 RepID=UPI00373674C6